MQKTYLLLANDRTWLESRIIELDREIQDLGPRFNDVFNQSSETWHDNAPFEALRDHQSVLFAELSSLRQILRHSTNVVPKAKKDTVSIGSTVTIGSHKKIAIHGDWTYLSGQTEKGITHVSSESPLAQELLHKKQGEMTQWGQINEIQ